MSERERLAKVIDRETEKLRRLIQKHGDALEAGEREKLLGLIARWDAERNRVTNDTTYGILQGSDHKMSTGRDA